ncbi:MAG: hypothetical protein ACLSF3_18935, partial [Anaerobutyricum hallii]
TPITRYIPHRSVRAQFRHVHDELIIECHQDASVESICSIMSRTPAWMPDILIRGDGYETPFYKKD